MNDTKFTPGPWYNATKKDSFQGLIYSEITGENIAVTFNSNNAALVAAAPDLLAVCKQIANLAHPSREGFDNASNLLYADDLAQELLEAINKAEGES